MGNSQSFMYEQDADERVDEETVCHQQIDSHNASVKVNVPNQTSAPVLLQTSDHITETRQADATTTRGNAFSSDTRGAIFPNPPAWTESLQIAADQSCDNDFELQAPIVIEEISLEESECLHTHDDTQSYEPIVEEPGNEDVVVTPSQDDGPPTSDRLEKSVQITDFIDELIQEALVNGQNKNIIEVDSNVDVPPKTKKSKPDVKKKINPKSKARATKSGKSANFVAGDGVKKTVQDSSVTEGIPGNGETKPIAWEIDCADFECALKTKPKKSSTVGPKRYQSKASKWMIPKDEFKDYTPPEVVATQDELAQRKMLDHRRWLCISRPQYSKSCGLSSLVGCWNYLYSTLGVGNHQPITQEQALTVLGFKPPFAEIRFGPFTGNATLMRWFQQLNNHYGMRGRSYYLYKPCGQNRTMGRSSDEALRLLKAGVQDESLTFIYHCWNHYFCPIGYEDVPLKAADAYRGGLTQQEVETWILVGESSRKHPGMHCFRWQDILIDLNCQMPEHLNVRKLHLGVQTRKTKKVGGNLHCIMAFQKSNWQGSAKTARKTTRKTTISKSKGDGSRMESSTQTLNKGMVSKNEQDNTRAQSVNKSVNTVEFDRLSSTGLARAADSSVEQTQGHTTSNESDLRNRPSCDGDGRQGMLAGLAGTETESSDDDDDDDDECDFDQ